MTNYDQILSRNHRLLFQNKINIDLEFGFRLESNVIGPEVVIYGAIHGNEPVGIEAIVKFISLIDNHKIQLIKGQITFVLGNPPAYLVNRRLIDSNLNRAFEPMELDYPEVFDTKKPNNSKSTVSQNNDYEKTRAREIQKYLSSLPQLDYCLDLHSVSVGDLKIAISRSEPEQVEFMNSVSNLSKQLTYDSNSMTGTTMDEGWRRGAKNCVIECGNHNDPEAFKFGLEHILRLLSQAKMIPQLELRESPKPIIRYNAITKVEVGEQFQWRLPVITSDAFVPKNCIISTLVDNQQLELNQKIENMKKQIASDDCYLLMPDRSPKPTDNDAGFLCYKSIIM